MGEAYKPQLDGLRFFFFLGVFLFHCNLNKYWFGSFGVCGFFVLSGFLITQILLSSPLSYGPTLWRFYVRRFLRIMPAYYLVLTLAVVFLGIPLKLWHFLFAFNIKLFSMSLKSDLEFWGLLSQWQNIGIHFWSLCIEEQFYILFAPFFLYIAPLRRLKVLSFFIIVSILIRLLYLKFYPQAFILALLPGSMEYLLVGSLAACLLHQQRSRLPMAKSYFPLGAGLIFFLFVFFKPTDTLALTSFVPNGMQTFYAFGFALIVASLWLNTSPYVTRFFSFAPFRFLGRISYGLYLIHLFMWPVANKLALPINAIVVRFALTVILATLVWFLFERPILSLKKFFPLKEVEDAKLHYRKTS